MEQRKICMLGAYGAGKTSLIDRYIGDVFAPDTRTSRGVRIEKKDVHTRGGDVTLVIWDMVGANKYQTVQTSYLRQASAYLLVLDGTNLESANSAIAVHHSVQETVGPLPFVVVVNKADDIAHWIPAMQTPWKPLENAAVDIIETSAKTGSGVAQAFETLAFSLTNQTVEPA